MKTIYHYDRATGFFIAAGSALADPEEEGSYLIPAFATEVPPPEAVAGMEVAVFDQASKAWRVEKLAVPGETVLLSQLTREQRVVLLQVGVQQHLDAQARSLGYDSIATAVTYAEEPAVPKFQIEGQALRAWRSLVWAKCYELLDDYQTALQAGGPAQEPTLAEVIAALPAFEVPKGPEPTEPTESTESAESAESAEPTQEAE